MTLIITRRMMASATLLVMGVPDHPGNAAEFNASQPVVRAILGGTRNYMGARGQLTNTRGCGRFVHASV